MRGRREVRAAGSGAVSAGDAAGGTGAAPAGPGSIAALRRLDPVAARHLAFGWWTLLLYLSIGIALETLHGFKLSWYLDADHETRRLLLTLGHAHGTLLAGVNIALAASLRALPALPPPRLASRFLIAATLLLPFGFLLGGAVVYGGDPGPGVLLVPPGALCLLVAVFGFARALAGRGEPAADEPAAPGAASAPQA